MKRLLLLFLFSLSLSTQAQVGPESINTLNLPGGISLQLEAKPSDPELLAQFESLSPEQQKIFYDRRKFLLKYLISGFSMPKFLGGLAWSKEKVSAIKTSIQKKIAGADYASDPIPPKFEEELDLDQKTELEPADLKSLKPNLTDRGKALIETVVTGFTQSLWKEAIYISKANGIGFTFVGGSVINTSLARWGFFWGRSLSVDIGVDFKTQKGYIRFLYDRQALKRAGLSFDTGFMFDFLIHFLKSDDDSKELTVDHYKLPIVGCFRSGPEYKAWGLQLGVHVLDIAALIISAHGMPEIGGPMLVGTRLIGAATVYSTTLKRKILKTAELPQKLISRILTTKTASPRCEAVYANF